MTATDRMTMLRVTFTYISPAGEEVDWDTVAGGSDGAHALATAVEMFQRAHVDGLTITEVMLEDLSES